MSYISDQIKSSVVNQLNSINAADIQGKAQAAIDSVGINAKVPELKVPEQIKSKVKLGDTTLNSLKLPAGVTNYIPKVAMDYLGDIRLPSEIGGIPLPKLPDLSSVTSEIQGLLSGVGIDTNKLGIRDVSSILKEPNLSSLKDVNVPTISADGTIEDAIKAMDGFSVPGLSGDIKEASNYIPELNDLTKYF